MKRIAVLLGMMIAVATSFSAEPAHLLDKANVLPLALDDQIQFRKVVMFLNDPKKFKPTKNLMIQFDRDRMNFGALTAVDREQRLGQYFTFFWRTDRKADSVDVLAFSATLIFNQATNKRHGKKLKSG